MELVCLSNARTAAAGMERERRQRGIRGVSGVWRGTPQGLGKAGGGSACDEVTEFSDSGCCHSGVPETAPWVLTLSASTRAQVPDGSGQFLGLTVSHLCSLTLSGSQVPWGLCASSPSTPFKSGVVPTASFYRARNRVRRGKCLAPLE